MNENKKFIGVFHNEAELFSKIDELTLNGYSEDDIYVISKDNDVISMLRGRTDVEVQQAGGSWSDRFMSFLTGEDPVRENLRKMGFTEEESERYYHEVRSGRYLLYVDQEYNDLYTGHDRTANDLAEEEKLRLHEERLSVNKDRVQTGEVRVEKEVVEENQVVDIPVEREEVFVERRHVDDNKNIHAEDDVLANGSRPFTNDEMIRVPITEERVEVTKKPVVSEEIVVGKRKTQDTETVRETVRREEAHIDEDHNQDRLKKQDEEFYQEIGRVGGEKRRL